MKKTKALESSLVTTVSNKLDNWNDFLSDYNSKFERPSNLKKIKRLSSAELDYHYANDAIVAKICDKPAQDMVRQWIDINDDKAEEINELHNKYNTKYLMEQLVSYDGVFGGSALIIEANDGQSYDMPLNIEKVKSIDDMFVVDRYFLNPINYNGFKLPELYNLSNFSKNYITLHESRMGILRGIDSGIRNNQHNNSFGESKIFRVINELSNYNGSGDMCPEFLNLFLTQILKFKGMTNAIQNGNGDKIKEKARAIKLAKNILGFMCIDTEDEFLTNSINLTGLVELIDKIEYRLCAAVGMPHTRLFEESPGNTMSNNGNNSEQSKQWYDYIKSQQEKKLLPVINKLHKIFQVLLKMDLKKPIKWRFNSLTQKTDNEISDIRDKVSKADKIYYDMGLDPKIIIKNRYGQGDYSMDIDLSNENIDTIVKDVRITKDLNNNNNSENIPIK